MAAVGGTLGAPVGLLGRKNDGIFRGKWGGEGRRGPRVGGVLATSSMLQLTVLLGVGGDSAAVRGGCGARGRSQGASSRWAVLWAGGLAIGSDRPGGRGDRGGGVGAEGRAEGRAWAIERWWIRFGSDSVNGPRRKRNHGGRLWGVPMEGGRGEGRRARGRRGVRSLQLGRARGGRGPGAGAGGALLGVGGGR